MNATGYQWQIQGYTQNGVHYKTDTQFICADGSNEQLRKSMIANKVEEIQLKDGSVFSLNKGWGEVLSVGTLPFPPEAVKTTEQRSQEDPEADGKNLLAARLIDAWCAHHGKPIPWNKAIDIVAIVTGMEEEKVKELKAL